MDDPIKAAFPDFKPQPAMFEAPTEIKQSATPTTPTNGETTRKRRGRPPNPTPAKTSRKGKPRGARRTMPVQPGPVAQVAAAVDRGEKKRRGRKPGVTRQMQVAVSALPALVGLKPDELSAVLQFADAIKVFGKRGRERIAMALGRLV